MVHVCIFACMGVCIMWAHVHKKVWRNCPQLLFCLIHEGRVSQSKQELTDNDSLVSLLALEETVFTLKRLGTTDELPWRPVIYMRFWGSNLQSSWQCGKYFNGGTTSPAQNHTNLNKQYSFQPKKDTTALLCQETDIMTLVSTNTEN